MHAFLSHTRLCSVIVFAMFCLRCVETESCFLAYTVRIASMTLRTAGFLCVIYAEIGINITTEHHKGLKYTPKKKYIQLWPFLVNTTKQQGNSEGTTLQKIQQSNCSTVAWQNKDPTWQWHNGIFTDIGISNKTWQHCVEGQYSINKTFTESRCVLQVWPVFQKQYYLDIILCIVVM